ncbi:MAG TPA: hypothetical protein VLH61_11140 [Bacteroidales bacterium]|nr:hypothetical protein [Bacteroidales bacterium]
MARDYPNSHFILRPENLIFINQMQDFSKQTRLKYILANSYKAGIISYMKAHPKDFDEAVNIAIADVPNYSWRAAWLVGCCMKDNDPRVQAWLETIIDKLPTKRDGHLRELLRIIQRMELNEVYEGKVFGICVNCWENTANNQSARYNAFKLIVKILKKHPDLWKEIIFLTEPKYLDTFTSGVRKSISNIVAVFNMPDKGCW